MRVNDLCESFGELDIIRNRIRELKSAETIFDFKACSVVLIFAMTDEDGVIKEGRATYRAIPAGLITPFEVLRKKLSACARSQSHGKSIQGAEQQMKMCARIGPNAIRILTNPQSMVLMSLRWAGYKYG
jgi:hypothetical protein